jgi:hypothetical protein
VSDFLKRLLHRVDASAEAILSAEEVEDWPADAFEWCIQSGLLSEAPPANVIACRHCEQQLIEEVVYLQAADGGRCQAYLPCSHCGPVPIASDQLRRWQIRVPRLAEVLLASVISGWDLRELVPRRLWRAGTAKWNGRGYVAFTGRSLHRRDAQGIIAKHTFPPRSILFVPAECPRASSFVEMPVLALASIVSWKNGNVEVDMGAIETTLEPVLNKQSATRKLRKRASRAGTIEALTRQLQEHVRAARDHALAAMERGRLPTHPPASCGSCGTPRAISTRSSPAAGWPADGTFTFSVFMKVKARFLGDVGARA